MITAAEGGNLATDIDVKELESKITSRLHKEHDWSG